MYIPCYNAADIWRQYDVGMTFDSDVGLTLQEGWKWKFSRRRILFGLVATKNQPDSNVGLVATKNQPDSNVFTTSCACWEGLSDHAKNFDLVNLTVTFDLIIYKTLTLAITFEL